MTYDVLTGTLNPSHSLTLPDVCLKVTILRYGRPWRRCALLSGSLVDNDLQTDFLQSCLGVAVKSVQFGVIIVHRLTCDCQRIDYGGDDHVGQGQVGDQCPPGVVSGGLGGAGPPAAAKALDVHRRDDDQVADCSDHGRDAQHSYTQGGDGRLPTVQRPRPVAAVRRLRAVRFSQPDNRKLHAIRLIDPAEADPL